MSLKPPPKPEEVLARIARCCAKISRSIFTAKESFVACAHVAKDDGWYGAKWVALNSGVELIRVLAVPCPLPPPPTSSPGSAALMPMSQPFPAPSSTPSISPSTISPSGSMVSPTPKSALPLGLSHPSPSTCATSPRRPLNHASLTTAREATSISPEQLTTLKAESTGSETLAQLLANYQASFSDAADRIRPATANFDTHASSAASNSPPPSAATLIHVAGHTQRHTGQVVTTAKLLKALRP